MVKKVAAQQPQPQLQPPASSRSTFDAEPTTKSTPKKFSLLDEDSESDSDSSSDSSEEETDKATQIATIDKDKDKDKLNVNKKFAQRYTLEKRQQSIKNAQARGIFDDALNGSGSAYSSSSSSSEDEDGELLTGKIDLGVLKVINSIRSKDPKIYEKGAKFFDSDDDDDDDDELKETKTKTKKMHYKDVVRSQILEDMEGKRKRKGKQDSGSGSDSDSNSNSDPEKGGPGKHRLAYDDEQQQLRKDFFSARDGGSVSDSGDDGDDVFKAKSVKGGRSAASDDDDDDYDSDIRKEYEKLNESRKSSRRNNNNNNNNNNNKAGASPLQDQLVDPHGEVLDGEKFLEDFLLNKKWVDVDGKEFDAGGGANGSDYR